MANELRAATEEEFIETAEADIEAEVGLWNEVFAEITERHQQYDRKMVDEYLRRNTLAEHDVRFVFSPGDKVLLR